MNIYLISRNENNAYETYDSAVVIAEDKEKARMISPDGSKGWNGKEGYLLSWCDAANVSAKLIGTASGDAESGIVCASYNAG